MADDSLRGILRVRVERPPPGTLDMDFAKLGLTRRPYRSAPDLASYFPAASHEAVLAGVRSARGAGESVALVDGDSGSGKTLVALRFMEQLRDVTRVLLPSAKFASVDDFFRAILFDLGRNHDVASPRLAVVSAVVETLAQSRPAVFVIDEAQHLSSEILEEIRLLGNLETRDGRGVFTLLVAQSTLRLRIAEPSERLVSERVAVRKRLDPLPREESVDYLRSHIQSAGGRPERFFTAEGLEVIAEHGKGSPRLLNRLASAALEMMISSGAEAIDAEVALEAVTLFVPEEPKPLLRSRGKMPKRKSA